MDRNPSCILQSTTMLTCHFTTLRISLLQCFYTILKPQVQKTIQEHVVSLLRNNYCAVFVVHFCIWHYQYALTQRPHLNLSCPQFLNLSFYLSNTKDRLSPTKFFSAPTAAMTYALTVHTHTHAYKHTHIHTHTHTHEHRFMCRHTAQTGKRVFRPTYQHTEANSTLQQRILLPVYKWKHQCHFFKKKKKKSRPFC